MGRAPSRDKNYSQELARSKPIPLEGDPKVLGEISEVGDKTFKMRYKNACFKYYTWTRTIQNIAIRVVL